MASDLLNLLQRLHAERAEFVVLGGMAMVSYGSATITNDLDICYRRTKDNYSRLVRALQPLHPRLRGVAADLPFVWDEHTLHNGLNFTLTTDAGDIDLLGEVAGVGTYEDLLAEAESMVIAGTPTLIIGLDQLIRGKQAARRPKDATRPRTSDYGQEPLARWFAFRLRKRQGAT